MSEISKVIASEIADFFAGFGGPGEPDIQSGEAQRLLTDRVLSVLALRERAEPVTVPDELPEFAPADVLKKYFNWTDDGDAEVFSMGWNACRAAMLQPVSQPYKLPEKEG